MVINFGIKIKNKYNTKYKTNIIQNIDGIRKKKIIVLCICDGLYIYEIDKVLTMFRMFLMGI